MKQETYTNLLSRTTEELFFYFKHDGGIDFNKKLAAGKILLERKYNTKKLRRERDIIVNSIKKDIAAFKDKSGLEESISKQHKKNIIYSIVKSLPIIALAIYLYFEEIKKENSNEYVFIIGILLLIAMVVYRVYTIRKKLKEIIASTEEDNQTQKQKLDLIAEEWTF